MKFNKLVESFNTIFSWDDKEVKQNSTEINDLVKKLIEKRDKLEKKFRKAQEKEKKIEIDKKLKALKKIIKRAKKSFN